MVWAIAGEIRQTSNSNNFRIQAPRYVQRRIVLEWPSRTHPATQVLITEVSQPDGLLPIRSRDFCHEHLPNGGGRDHLLLTGIASLTRAAMVEEHESVETTESVVLQTSRPH